MHLQNLTEEAIRAFGGITMFTRGEQYANEDMVHDLLYHSDTDSLEATVSGNYGAYDVYATTKDEVIEASCNCPYDGYPCKHMVAALLTFQRDKENFIKAEAKRRQVDSSLARKVSALSQEKLVELVLSYAKQFPDVKRDLMVRLQANTQETLATITDQIDRAFPDVESRNYSIPTIVKQLRTILKTVENAPKGLQIQASWALADRTLQELNDYGIDDESLESVVIDTLEDLTRTFLHTDGLQEEKETIIRRLMAYYNQGNCGITDWIYDTVIGLCMQKSDYQIVIDALEARLEQETTFPSFYQGLLSNLYAEIGDTEARRAVLEKNLVYGADYWRLAQFWFEQGDDEQGWEIVHDGLQEGKGRKTELYEALQNHYLRHGDYDRILELLKRKLERNDLDHGPRRIHLDGTYQCLWLHYCEENNYDKLLELLDLRVKNNAVDLEFYTEAQRVLTDEHWQAVEPRVIQHLRDRIAEHHEERRKKGWENTPYTSHELTALSEIYHYKGDAENLFQTVKENFDLLQKYEELLLPQHPQEFLERYQAKIERLIAERGRNNYRSAAAYAVVVKQIYTEYMQQPDEWAAYIQGIRTEYTTLRALQQEFAKL